MPIIIKNNSSKEIFNLIKNKIIDKEVVVLPTETVYGLAGLGTSLVAAKKIYKLKGRPFHKKLIFHCSDIKMVKKFFYLEHENLILADKFWPGPITLILKRKSKKIPLKMTKNNLCAVRIPNNIFTLNLIKQIQYPIIMPSANKFKRLSPINAKMVFDQFLDTNLIIIDDKKCKIGLESTLVKIIGNKLEILRPGKINIINIRKILPYIENIKIKSNKSFSGSSKKHYSPQKKLYLNQSQIRKNSAFINFGKNKKGQFKNLSEKGNLNEAAKNLYHYIFLADKNKMCTSISISPIPNNNLGIAINDRLKRASK